MSSYYGGGFKEWLEDSLFQPISKESVSEISALLEPWRAGIEEACAEFDSDTQSWRDYRNALWNRIPEKVNAKISEILEIASVSRSLSLML